MTVLVAKDKLVRKTVSLSMQRLEMPLICFENYRDSADFIRENSSIVQSIILDADIEQEQHELFLSSVSELDSQVRILLYSDYPTELANESKELSGRIISRTKPLILGEILDFISYYKGRNDVQYG